MHTPGVTDETFVRLSPWAVLHFTARTILKLVTNAVTLVPVVYGLYQANSVLISAGLLALLLGLVLLSAIMRYLHFSWRLGTDGVQIRSGVLSKKQLNLAFQRIQNVTIQHPFYFRLLELVTVKIDSAGSASEEVFLAALEIDRAEWIRERVRANRQSADDPRATPAEHATEVGTAGGTPELLLSRSLADLVIHGLTNNRAWIFLGAAGAAYGQLSEVINDWIASLGLDPGGYLADSSFVALVGIAFTLAVLATLLMAGLSVLGSILTYYDFRLLRSNDVFVVRRGLLTRHEVQMKQSRIQAVQVKRDWLDMVLGRMNVVFEQIAHARANHNANREPAGRILMPSVEPAQADMLSAAAIGAPELSALEFTPVSRRYFFRTAAFASAAYLAVGGALATNPAVGPLALLLVPVWLTHCAVLHLRWKRWGLAIHGGIVVIRRGVIGIDHLLLQAFKIQEVARHRTPLMRRHRLSSLRLSVASTSITIPHLSDAVVIAAINHVLQQVEASNRSWM